MGLLLAKGWGAAKALGWRTGNALLKLALLQMFIHIMHFGVGRGDDSGSEPFARYRWRLDKQIGRAHV